jgi:hypothetical protein
MHITKRFFGLIMGESTEETNSQYSASGSSHAQVIIRKGFARKGVNKDSQATRLTS